MAEKKQEKVEKIMKEKKVDVASDKPKKSEKCEDKKCPFHGTLSARGREFRGTVTKMFPKRITIEIGRYVFVPKFERYLKKKSKMHAHLPDCLADKVKIGSYVRIAECRPLSKIIHHVVVGIER